MSLDLRCSITRSPAKKRKPSSGKKEGYENVRAKDFANKIFLTGNLTTNYFGSKNKENFDWEGLARKYKDKLRPEFIDENILTARVQALRILTRTDDKKWPEYIKYNIELIERYGTDTTNSYVDATVINNFVFNGIFLHGNDPEHYEKGLRWMEGVIRRNPKRSQSY